MISFLFKFYLYVTNNAQELFSKQRPISHSEQTFDIPKETECVHQPLIHHNAYIHATGEAKYVDDIPSQQNTLHGALLLSNKPYARILSISTEEAQQISGFVKFYSHRNIPLTGTNKHGDPVQDEEVFASEFIHCVGMVIGLCVADTEEHARQAVALIRIEYEELSPVILTIDEAIEHESYLGPPGQQEKLLQIGNIDKGFNESDHVLEGTFYVGGQEHFYMEPNAFLVQPVNEGHYTQLHVYSTTQATSRLQSAIAEALGRVFEESYTKYNMRKKTFISRSQFK
jgi:xanthine dehydrogenase/oxidase